MNTDIELANAVALQRFIYRYLAPVDDFTEWTLFGASIYARPIAKRYGVPLDAVACRYIVDNVDEGWSCSARTVWLGGMLLEPKAVHTCIDAYFVDNADLIPDEGAAKAAANRWFRALPL
ncbi:MAG: hypothetical protein K1X67_09585 [Fimbriimonadaceae bacterium]|nr:hypothetical protein [Fimbriimonadaceae bacterium]